MVKKALLSLLTFLVLSTPFLSIFATSIHAQGEVGPWYNQNPAQWYTKVYDDSVNPPEEIFGERYTAAQVQWIIYSVLTFPLTLVLKPTATACLLNLAFGGTVDVSGCLGIADAGSNLEPSSALASLQPENKGLVAQFLEDRPLSGITYVKNIGRDWHIVPEASAQTGFGYSALSPLQTMWTATRNITYGLMVFVVLVMAFMIMFRTRISPQAVITVQSALPRIIITLLLITFSYAIAGFVVDIMYVVIGIISLIGTAVVPVSASSIYTFLTNPPGGLFGMLILYLIAFIITFFILLLNNIGIIGIALGTALATVTPIGWVGLVLALIFLAIMSFIAIWNGIKAVWELVKAFANVVILVVFAPFQIAMGAVTKGMGFGSWLRSLIANLAVFVATGVLLLFSYVFMWQAIEMTRASYGSALTDTLGFAIAALFGTGAAIALDTGTVGSTWPPFLGGSGSVAMPFLFLITSFVFWTLIPQAANIVKGIITGKPFAYGTAIGQTMSPISAPIGATWKEVKGPVVGAGLTYVKSKMKTP